MYKILMYLFLFVVSSCSLYDPSLPEEFILQDVSISHEDFDVMIKTGFDFLSLAPNGKTYLECLLGHPEPLIKDLLKEILDKKIIAPNWVDANGRGLINYVLSNSGDVSNDLLHILLESKDKNIFLKVPYNPLLDIINNSSKSIIRWRNIAYLVDEGISFNTADPKTGRVPTLEFFEHYDGIINDKLHTLISKMDLSIKDRFQNNIWHFLFRNNSSNIVFFTEFLLKDQEIKNLLTKANKEEKYPIEFLVEDPYLNVFFVYNLVKPYYEKLFTKQDFINQLFLCILQNTGPSLSALFQEIQKYNPSVNAQNILEQNSLLVAVQNTNPSIIPIISYILKQKVDIYKLDKIHYGVLTYTVLNPSKTAVEILKLLDKEGISLIIADDYGRNLVSYVMQNKGPSSIDILDFLLQKGINPILPDKDEKIPMEILVHNTSKNGIEMLRKLIYYSYQGFLDEPYSRYIILETAQSESPYAYKMMLTLIQYGFSFKVQNLHRQNALFFTVQNPGPNALEMTRLLLRKGLTSDIIDKEGNSLLMFAVANKSHKFSMVNLLLKWGADPYRKNIHGESLISKIKKMPKKTRNRFLALLKKHDIKVI